MSCACFVAPAGAADFGGNCCADLEERIAELEATTAKKGNRRVSLKLSGWVAEQMVYWDDGVESNVYMTGLGTAFASNFNFTGEAKITEDVSAGYVLHVELITNDVYTTNQNSPRGPGLTGSPNSLQLLYSYWYLKSERLGKLSVGLQSPADDNAIVSLDQSGSLVAAYWVAYDVFGFNVRGNFAPGNSMIWGNAVSCRGWGGGPGDCDGLPRDVVRYDSPAYGGFSFSTSWGEDDAWAIAARHFNTLGDWKVNAIATYGETMDSAHGAPWGGKLKYTQAGLYLQNMPTGLFAIGGFGHLDQTPTPNALNNPSTNTYYVKAGLRRTWTELGATIPYGEYLLGTDGAMMVNDNGTPLNVADDVSWVVDGSKSQFWGVGVVQEIDAAAMSMWLRYRNHSVDVPGVNTKDMSTFAFGAFINF
ncbi:porin [Hyphomicrobium sp. D-2]|uniref:porin n=1 Tax=Hyphomicrobium sp. D-2 TaxID=3041621 RepID=UPI002454F26C|nr:porin [Hyphomicrobium sp. D-2]MDH4981208.1 porin [Hyphomicrobium sp. D-2]